jgi:hypothetical protein
VVTHATTDTFAAIFEKPTTLILRLHRWTPDALTGLGQ